MLYSNARTFCDLGFETWVLVVLFFGTSDIHGFRTWDTVLWDFEYTGFGTWDIGLWNFGYKEL